MRRRSHGSASPAWLVACRGLAVGALAIGLVIGVLAVFGDADPSSTAAIAAPNVLNATDATGAGQQGTQGTQATTPTTAPLSADSAAPAVQAPGVAPGAAPAPVGGSAPAPAAEEGPAPTSGPVLPPATTLPPRRVEISKSGDQLVVSLVNFPPGGTVTVVCTKFNIHTVEKVNFGSFSAHLDGSGYASGSCSTAGVDMAESHAYVAADGYYSRHLAWDEE